MKPIDGCPQKFIHPDLAEGQIRLLSLRGGSGSDEVDCDLLITSLDDQVDYEALSYVWGDASDTRPIRLCGQPFHVTVNLESALRNLRQTDRPCILWVDALCINQRNVSERNKQVSLMDQIYTRATQVIVWLGQCSASRELVIDAIEKLGSNEDLHWIPQAASSALSLGSQNADSQQDHFTRLTLFLTDPWWKRVWTLQEFVLARKIRFLCGRLPLTFESLDNFINSYNSHVDNCCRQLRDWEQLEDAIRSVFSMMSIRREISNDTLAKRIRYLTVKVEAEEQKIVMLRNINQGNWSTMLIAKQHEVKILLQDEASSLSEKRARFLDLMPKEGIVNPTEATEQQKEQTFELAESVLRLFFDPKNLDTDVMRYGEAAQDLLESLQELLVFMHDQSFRECLDPRDKIYGFLGLTINLEKRIMFPDYSLPTAAVYREFAFYIIRETRNVNIFSLVLPWRSSPEYATWAPDWAEKFHSGVFVTISNRFAELSSFQASGALFGDMALVSDRALLIQGCVIDRVSHICSEPMTGTGWTQYLESPLWSGLDRILQRPYGNGHTWGDAFCYCLLSCGHDIHDGSTQIPPWIKYYLGFERGRGKKGEFGSDRDGSSADPMQQLSLECTQEQQGQLQGAVHSAIHMRRLVISEKRYLGLVPMDTQPGDKICILFGGRVPFILRETSEQVEIDGINHKCHILLGDSYIHGLMQGEAAKMIERQEVGVQNFYLV
jgi:hypothetical protein